MIDEARGAKVRNSVYWMHRGRFHSPPDETPAAQKESLRRAAEKVAEADALLFVTGAGMGVDMGLADFRSSNAFWEGLGHPEITRYEDASDSAWFEKDPALAWGINYTQLEAYRSKDPHKGYKAMLTLASMKGPDGYFCWTSNVDGVFERAGFDPSRVVACHGNIHRLQCTRGRDCVDPSTGKAQPWDAMEPLNLEVDKETCRVQQKRSPLPVCPLCGALARPNVWFCTDNKYVPDFRPKGKAAALADHPTTPAESYIDWISQIEDKRQKLVVIECGAGLVIPSCRVEAEDRAAGAGGTLIRVNFDPADCCIPPNGVCEELGQTQEGTEAIGIPMGAADAMVAILEHVWQIGKSKAA